MESNEQLAKEYDTKEKASKVFDYEVKQKTEEEETSAFEDFEYENKVINPAPLVDNEVKQKAEENTFFYAQEKYLNDQLIELDNQLRYFNALDLRLYLLDNDEQKRTEEALLDDEENMPDYMNSRLDPKNKKLMSQQLDIIMGGLWHDETRVKYTTQALKYGLNKLSQTQKALLDDEENMPDYIKKALDIIKTILLNPKQTLEAKEEKEWLINKALGDLIKELNQKKVVLGYIKEILEDPKATLEVQKNILEIQKEILARKKKEMDNEVKQKTEEEETSAFEDFEYENKVINPAPLVDYEVKQKAEEEEILGLKEDAVIESASLVDNKIELYAKVLYNQKRILYNEKKIGNHIPDISDLLVPYNELFAVKMAIDVKKIINFIENSRSLSWDTLKLFIKSGIESWNIRKNNISSQIAMKIFALKEKGLKEKGLKEEEIIKDISNISEECQNLIIKDVKDLLEKAKANGVELYSMFPIELLFKKMRMSNDDLLKEKKNFHSLEPVAKYIDNLPRTEKWSSLLILNVEKMIKLQPEFIKKSFEYEMEELLVNFFEKIYDNFNNEKEIDLENIFKTLIKENSNKFIVLNAIISPIMDTYEKNRSAAPMDLIKSFILKENKIINILINEFLMEKKDGIKSSFYNLLFNMPYIFETIRKKESGFDSDGDENEKKSSQESIEKISGIVKLFLSYKNKKEEMLNYSLNYLLQTLSSGKIAIISKETFQDNIKAEPESLKKISDILSKAAYLIASGNEKEMKIAVISRQTPKKDKNNYNQTEADPDRSRKVCGTMHIKVVQDKVHFYINDGQKQIQFVSDLDKTQLGKFLDKANSVKEQTEFVSELDEEGLHQLKDEASSMMNTVLGFIEKNPKETKKEEFKNPPESLKSERDSQRKDLFLSTNRNVVEKKESKSISENEEKIKEPLSPSLSKSSKQMSLDH